MERNNYEYLFLTKGKINDKNIMFNLNEDSKVITKGSRKWFKSMELIKFKLLTINNLGSLSKIYIKIRELINDDNLKYHFICDYNNYDLIPLNKFYFNKQNTCLVIPRLTFSFYFYNKDINDLEQIQINIELPLELIINYE
jgi:hypothetical protein